MRGEREERGFRENIGGTGFAYSIYRQQLDVGSLTSVLDVTV